MKKAFQVFLETHKNTEIRDFSDGPLDNLTRLIATRDIMRPGVIAQLLEAESDSPTFLVHRDDFTGDLLSFFDHLAWVANLPCPRHIGDMQ